jgi:hypothetical protein
MDPIAPPPPHGLPVQNPPGAVGSLVCGIVSIVVGWFPIAGIVLGIIAIVLAGKAKKAAIAQPTVYVQGGMRVAGLVCGIIGLVWCSIVTIMWIFVAGAIATDPEFRDEFQRKLREAQER